MSDGSNYGFSWQAPVGWLGSTVPTTTPKPDFALAKKLAYYMAMAVPFGYFYGEPEDIPHDSFYMLDGGRGPHTCEISRCPLDLSGVFGYRNWKFPTGIIHYILDHNYYPPEEFIRDLQDLPDPPDAVTAPIWCVPNLERLLQKR